MAFFDALYDKNFIEYASYVIKDRAIPNVEDGLKPVQRRILHALFESDDGKFHKVANIVGQSMKYHPHGDASIYSALVVLANKDMFIEKQGNFGNIYTGDSASAARYIECRITPMAKEVLYNPELTQYEDSYDGRNKEPLAFPAKIPVLLAHGTEGIAVGMATKILPHNLIELINAQISCLKKKSFQLFPDFATGGFIDVSEYNDGNGKVLVRALLELKDQGKIVVREIPFSTTTESIIASIENAARNNKIKISSINDFTAEDVEIEIKMARGADSRNLIETLYAFTDCEISISANLMVVRDKKPRVMTVPEVIQYNTGRLVEILKMELVTEEGHLKDKLHIKTLEQIFIEQGIYKEIEGMDTQGKVASAVFRGLISCNDQIDRPITKEDIETLLKIPIRRISLYDINKAKKEVREIKNRLKEIKGFLNKITDYAVKFLEGLIDKYRGQYPRKTRIISFEKVDIRKAAKRDIRLFYDKAKGYIGSKVEGNFLLLVSPYDRILIIRGSGVYFVVDVPEKLFIDKGMWFCGFIEKERVYNILYKDKKTGYIYIKRCQIDKFILGKEYAIIPDGSIILDMTNDSNLRIKITYKAKPKMRKLEDIFNISDYLIKGSRSSGNRLSKKDIKSGKFVKP